MDPGKLPLVSSRKIILPGGHEQAQALWRICGVSLLILTWAACVLLGDFCGKSSFPKFAISAFDDLIDPQVILC
jgi:hypothetical protein